MKTIGVNKAAWRLLQPVLLLHFIILTGIIGFMLIEHFNFVDAVYMTTISVTTAGFTEVHPLSAAGRLFTVFLLVTSWSSFAFIISRITEYIVSGEINKYFKTRRIMSAIEKLHNHVIICGYGRNGQQAAQTLRYHQQPFIVIENNEDLMKRIAPEQNDLLYMIGNSTDDDLLKKAGIERARALITTLPVDADNVFIALSARSLNPAVQVISRASESGSYPKLLKAGANNVIMPDRIGGAYMASLVSQPDVVEFMEYLSGEGGAINIESVAFEQLPLSMRDRPLEEIMAWKKTGVNCIGIKKADGAFEVNPAGTTRLEPGMKVLVLGTRWQIGQMKANLGSITE